MNRRGSVHMVLVVVIVLLVGIAGYFAFKKSSPSPKNEISNSNNSQTQTQTPDASDLTISPTTGKAPLPVTVSFDGCNPLLTWGDGTNLEGGYGMNTCGGGIPVSEHPILSESHIYTVPGIYTISLFKSLDVNSKPISTATVNVMP